MSDSDKKKNRIEQFIERNHEKAGFKKIPGDTPLQKRINKNRIDSGRESKEFNSKS